MTKPAIGVKIWKLGFSLQTVFRYLNFNRTKFHDDLKFSKWGKYTSNFIVLFTIYFVLSQLT